MGAIMMRLSRVTVAFVLVSLGVIAASAYANDEGFASPLPASSAAVVESNTDETALPTKYSGTHVPAAATATVLYFVPSDHDQSTTCLFLMNGSTVAQTVMLDGYDSTGLLSNHWNVPIPAASAVRACSDALAASPPPSWATMTVVNFADSTAYVRATLPARVQIDGFIANTGTATYDPNASSNTIELRFSPDVATTTVVHFTPQDNNANATCLNLYNTSSVAATAQIRGFDDGGLSFLQSLNIAAGALVRACSDAMVASPPPSWANVTIVNFTDNVYRAELILPANVKVDGFVVWNPGTGTIDPRTTSSNFLNLRFEVAPGFDQIFADGFEGPTG
jgi:hypothetical protein